LSYSNRLLGQDHQLLHQQAFLEGIQASKFACSFLILEVNSVLAVFGYMCVFGEWMAQEVELEVSEVSLLCIWS